MEGQEHARIADGAIVMDGRFIYFLCVDSIEVSVETKIENLERFLHRNVTETISSIYQNRSSVCHSSMYLPFHMSMRATLQNLLSWRLICNTCGVQLWWVLKHIIIEATFRSARRNAARYHCTNQNFVGLWGAGYTVQLMQVVHVSPNKGVAIFRLAFMPFWQREY
jgi:hypothetical protein